MYSKKIYNNIIDILKKFGCQGDASQGTITLNGQQVKTNTPLSASVSFVIFVYEDGYSILTVLDDFRITDKLSTSDFIMRTNLILRKEVLILDFDRSSFMSMTHVDCRDTESSTTEFYGNMLRIMNLFGELYDKLLKVNMGILSPQAASDSL